MDYTVWDVSTSMQAFTTSMWTVIASAWTVADPMRDARPLCGMRVLYAVCHGIHMGCCVFCVGCYILYMDCYQPRFCRSEGQKKKKIWRNLEVFRGIRRNPKESVKSYVGKSIPIDKINNLCGLEGLHPFE